MSNEGSEKPDKYHRIHNLGLTVGSADSGDDGYEDEISDMRSRMQSFALGNGALEIPKSTLFIEDIDLIGPTTSSSLSQHPSLTQQLTPAVDLSAPMMSPIDCEGTFDEPGMGDFVKGFFSDGNTLFNPKIQTNYIEEIFAEKRPKIINDYLFGHLVGEGSYSRVKEVLHIKNLVRRAVKIIKDKKLRKIPGGIQNVQQEIEVLQRINHKNIVKLNEVFRIEEKQKLYIVMEFCVCSLQQLLDNCPERILPEFQAHLYFREVLDGLDHLHSCGIIHKDIKPGNLLLSLEGVVKICDLGVAEILNDPNDDWCTLAQGTPKFQAPEVVSGLQKRFRGRLVDIWSLGITLYNFVSAEYPFDGDGIMKLFDNITNHPVKMPQNVQISHELKELLTNVLEKDPAKRWDSVSIRLSNWFTQRHKIEHSRIVRVPSIKDIPSHRPLGVYRALELLFGVDEDVDRSVSLLESTVHKPSDSLIGQPSSASMIPTTSITSSFPEQGASIKRQQPHESFLCDDNVKKKHQPLPPHQNQSRNRRNPSRSIARLRQIFFLGMLFLLVLLTALVLWLML